MNGSPRKVVAAGAALLFGLAVSTGVMAEAKAPHKAAAHSAMHKHGPSMLVKSIQEALNKSGAKLAADGYMGKKTRAAIKTFQSAHGLKATGHADTKTRKALGLKG
ncbi:MAG TPA: peptidoglycan-binding domain-containing protein [Pseudodesulfovibrio sp.]|nr:peptidoglycan-binding domain-containing protein [Pseudodesulfovibrio sp.]